jgi:hypothetical protein
MDDSVIFVSDAGVASKREHEFAGGLRVAVCGAIITE